MASERMISPSTSGCALLVLHSALMGVNVKFDVEEIMYLATMNETNIL